LCFFFASRRRHTRWPRDWSSDVCSSDLLEAQQIGGDRALAFVIEAGERLVHEQDGRPRHQSARQRDSLLLASGKLVRLGVHSMFEANTVQHLADASLSFVLSNSPGVEPERQIFLDGHVRPQRKVLKHHSQVTFLRRNEILSYVCDEAAIDLD